MKILQFLHTAGLNALARCIHKLYIEDDKDEKFMRFIGDSCLRTEKNFGAIIETVLPYVEVPQDQVLVLAVALLFR